MRPDTKSFSFTWLRGHQHEQELSIGRPVTRQLMAMTRRTGDYQQMNINEDVTSENMDDNCNVRDRPTSSRLRRFGTSLIGTMVNRKYDSMVDEDSPKDSTVKVKTLPVKSRASIGNKLNRTVQDVKTRLGNLSQRLRGKNYKRCDLESSPRTPESRTRRILGRTPTKLYSPFNFDSPVQKTPKRLSNSRSAQTTPKPSDNGRDNKLVNRRSSKGSLVSDFRGIRHGLNKFHLLPHDSKRRSVRF